MREIYPGLFGEPKTHIAACFTVDRESLRDPTLKCISWFLKGKTHVTKVRMMGVVMLDLLK